MPRSSFFGKLGKRTANGLVGLASGSTPFNALDSPQAYRTILVLGLIAIGTSGWLLYHSITAATALPKLANTATNTVTASAALLKLQTKDTDGDGLSDYEELYTTHTSPYLNDSDSDGVPDNTEYQKGSDPNCPSGKVCEGFRLLTATADASGQPTPEFLRRSLAAAGVPQATLDKTDDASLLRIYQQVTGQTGTNTNSAGTNASATNASSITNSLVAGTGKSIDQLSSAEIRQLLIENGVDAASLSTVDDATLKQIFTQAINTSATP